MSHSRSFCITIRPRAGICDERIQQYVKWASKQDGAYGALEGDGTERHLHMQLFFRKPRTKGDVNIRVVEIFNRLPVEDGEVRVLRSGTRFAYNMDWIEGYLQKGDRTVVIDNVPDDVLAYFPTEEEQERIKDQKKAVDDYFHEHSVKCRDFVKLTYECPNDYISKEQVQHYYGWAMYKAKVMKCITDPRILARYVTTLYRYLCDDEFALWDDKDKKIVYDDLRSKFVTDEGNGSI